MKNLKYLFPYIIILLINSGCPRKSENQVSVEKIDSNLVIIAMPKDISSFRPIVPSNLIKHESQYKDAALGKSYNSATGNVHANLLKYNFKKEEINTEILGEKVYDFKQVTDVYDLIEKFNLNIDASIKYFNFKGSARLQFAKQLQINAFHEFIVARVLVKDREESLKELWIREEAAQLARDNKSLFVSKYGDQVITSKVIGGDLLILIEIESKNREEKDSNKGSISASFNAWAASGKLSTDLEKSLEEISKTSRYSVRLIENGVVSDTITKYSNYASLKSLIDNFPKLVHKDGKVLEYKLSSIFHGVQGLPENINSLDFIKINIQKYLLNTIDINMNGLLATLPDLEYVINNSQLFTKDSRETAKKLYNLNYQAYRIHELNWSICASHPDLCNRAIRFNYHPLEFNPTFDSSAIAKKPKRKEEPLPISTAYKIIVTIPKSTTAAINFEGKVKYKHTRPLDCRVPALNKVDFNLAEFEHQQTGGVLQKVKLMPIIQLQFFEQKGDAEVPYSDPFYYRGVEVSVPASERNLILKARMDLAWIVLDANLNVQISSLPVDQKPMHIEQHISHCDNRNEIIAIIIQ